MSNVRLPRLLDSSLRELGRVEPLTLSLEMNLKPFSTAVMTLPASAPPITTGQFMELFTPHGSAGIFRVEQVECRYPAPSRVTLMHALVTLADNLVFTPEETTRPAAAFLQETLTRQSLWRWGAIGLPEDAVITWSSEAASVWECLQAVLEQFPGHRLVFDQSSAPWMIHLVPMADECPAECRLTRNLRSLTIETDRSELCTRLHLPGAAEPLIADTAALWGVVERTLSADPALPQEEILALGQQYLAQHKNPRVSITMDALELSAATGSALDSFQPGSLCRICLPEENTTLLHRIISLSYPDVCASPDAVRVTLSNTVTDASSVLSGLLADAERLRRQLTVQQNRLADQTKLVLAAGETLAQLDQSFQQQGSALDMKANKTDLLNYVTTEELAGEAARVNAFFSGGSPAAELIAENLTCLSFHFAGSPCAWASTEVVTDVSVASAGEITVYDAHGNVAGTALTGVNLLPAKQMIYYITTDADGG